jgi:sterol desaturase/sphingolipid hydroxylase (fatty acid hydroxylase superfamily)
MEAPDTGSEKKDNPEKKYLFDDPKNVKILLGCFYASLVVLLLIEFLLHKHPHFGWEAWPEFFAVYGFVACVVLVIVAKYFLRPLVKRDEDYYD